MPVTSSAIQAGTGLLQTGIGLLSYHKNMNELNKLPNPQYQESKAISDYYNEAQNRYNISPYASNFYNEAKRNAEQGFSQGIDALQSRRSAVGNIGALYGAEQSALGGAAAKAEGMRTQAFSQLGTAARMKEQEDQKAFDINQMMPFERKYNQIMSKMQANAQLTNAGLGNVTSGIVGQPTAFGTQGGIGSLFKSNPSTAGPTPSLDDLSGVGVQSTGAMGSSGGYGYLLNPNTPLMLAGG
jgi:hypothetical protein